jgi:hypothetical protein
MNFELNKSINDLQIYLNLIKIFLHQNQILANFKIIQNNLKNYAQNNDIDCTRNFDLYFYLIFFK